jgi:serine/threonine-protein kinase
LLGPVGFSRTVAIKRLHPQFAKDPEFVAMFMDEARLASRIRHPNVVSILDMVAAGGELLLVMDYVVGESLSWLLRQERMRTRVIAVDVAARIVLDLLSGMHAAHEATNDRGVPLGIVHRDVSPQNVLVGENGTSHLIDFGVAKAGERVQTTRDGQLKGKLRYMAPEQIRGGPIDRRIDIYAAGIVLWEALVGRHIFEGAEANVMYNVLSTEVPRPGSLTSGIPSGVDAVVMRAVSKDPAKRFATALEMADALEDALQPATPRQVARWVWSVAGPSLEKKARLIAEIEGLNAPSRPPGREELNSISEVSEVLPPVAVISVGDGGSGPVGLALGSGVSALSDAGTPLGEPGRVATNKRRWFAGVAIGGLGLLLAAAGVMAVVAGRPSDSTNDTSTRSGVDRDAEVRPNDRAMMAPVTSASDAASTVAPIASAEPSDAGATSSAPPVVTAAPKPTPSTQPKPVDTKPTGTSDVDRRREQRKKERGW